MAVASTSTSTAITTADLPARQDVTFRSGRETCAAWLYPRPASSGPAPSPAIVIGHGLGGVKEMRLDAYGERFQRAGYTVLVFDYRYFGESTGEPRHLLSIRAQLADWAAAIAYVRSLEQVDPKRVAILGSSFGGGHAMSMAVRDPTLACAISQCPFTSGFASAKTVGLLTLPFIAIRALLDQLLGLLALIGLFRRWSIRVKLAGKPGEVALMNRADVLPGIGDLIDLDKNWHRNFVGARIALWLPLYFPGWAARKSRIPIFVGICGKDTVAPPGPTLWYAKRIPKGEYAVYEDVGHFSIYIGKAFERAIADYLAFLNKHVPIHKKP
ncbi:hypothetical protein OC844_007813 [Tilletia horrida]|nr:hypothetical protein OC844_007813 [Tilletia horrida]